MMLTDDLVEAKSTTTTATHGAVPRLDTICTLFVQCHTLLIHCPYKPLLAHNNNEDQTVCESNVVIISWHGNKWVCMRSLPLDLFYCECSTHFIHPLDIFYLFPPRVRCKKWKFFLFSFLAQCRQRQALMVVHS